MDIIASIEHALSVMSVGSEISLESVLDANDKAMAVTRSWIAKKGK
jgi:hypothetical protein